MIERSSNNETAPAPEKVASLKPIIVSYVTLGKELHAGHILLMATADLLRKGLGEEGPIFLVNNNTGPRASGALVAAAQKLDLDLEETAQNLTQAVLPVEEVINAYRNRIEQGEVFERGIQLLDQGHYDIFAAVSKKIQSKLDEIGFEAKIMPESQFILSSQDIIEQVNPVWRNTGFMFSTAKGVKILKKGGQLTATGKSLVSLLGLSQLLVEKGEKAMPIFIDASTDALDSVSVFSALLDFGQAALLPGAGISFNGEIASGTQGEALTLTELVRAFQIKCPEGSLVVALRHMILSMPVVRIYGDVLSLYDFKDNNSVVNTLVDCYKRSQEFKQEMIDLTESLKGKIGNSQVSNKDINKWLQFLPQRTKAILNTKTENVLGFMSNFSPLRDSDVIKQVVERQGYSGKEASMKTSEYRNGQKGLFYRDNYYLSIIRKILSEQEQVVSLTDEDFAMLNATIQFCMGRLGYDTN